MRAVGRIVTLLLIDGDFKLALEVELGQSGRALYQRVTL
jgi:hypothetical protein